MIFNIRMFVILAATLVVAASQVAFAQSSVIVERCMGEAAKLMPNARFHCVDAHPVICTLTMKFEGYGPSELMEKAQKEAARCVEQAGFQKRGQRDSGANYHSADGKRKISFDHWTRGVIQGERELVMWTYIPWGTARHE